MATDMSKDLDEEINDGLEGLPSDHDPPVEPDGPKSIEEQLELMNKKLTSLWDSQKSSGKRIGDIRRDVKSMRRLHESMQSTLEQLTPKEKKESKAAIPANVLEEKILATLEGAKNKALGMNKEPIFRSVRALVDMPDIKSDYFRKRFNVCMTRLVHDSKIAFDRETFLFSLPLNHVVVEPVVKKSTGESDESDAEMVA